MTARPDRPLFLLDLAMPPDVEPEAGEIPGVTLYGLDALTGIADEHRSERQAAAEHAEGIIDREVEHFKELLVGAESEPLIRALGERAESVRSEELARALRRISSLADDDREVIDAMTRAIVKKLLADPISYLRELEDLESASAVAVTASIWAVSSASSSSGVVSTASPSLGLMSSPKGSWLARSRRAA